MAPSTRHNPKVLWARVGTTPNPPLRPPCPLPSPCHVRGVPRQAAGRGGGHGDAAAKERRGRGQRGRAGDASPRWPQEGEVRAPGQADPAGRADREGRCGPMSPNEGTAAWGHVLGGVGDKRWGRGHYGRGPRGGPEDKSMPWVKLTRQIGVPKWGDRSLGTLGTRPEGWLKNTKGGDTSLRCPQEGQIGAAG